jgi:hypothetical protein
VDRGRREWLSLLEAIDAREQYARIDLSSIASQHASHRVSPTGSSTVTTMHTPSRIIPYMQSGAAPQASGSTGRVGLILCS